MFGLLRCAVHTSSAQSPVDEGGGGLEVDAHVEPTGVVSPDAHVDHAQALIYGGPPSAITK